MENNKYKYAIETGQYPPYVYRYRPNDTEGHTLDSIKNNYLWFSDLQSFNDPYEGQIRLSHDYTEDELKAFIDMRKKGWPTDLLKRCSTNPTNIINDLIETTKSKIRMCCFSESNNNILLWSHYAQRHEGVCLQFDFAENQTNLFQFFRAVNYCSSFSSSNYIRNSIGTIEHLIFTKAIDWSYEKEYRAAFPELENNKVYYSPNVLKRIIFGCRASEDFKAKIKAVAPPKVTFSQCVLNKYHYKLDIIDEVL